MKAGDAAKLARVLALLGSEFPGERASAALVAHRLMKRLGLSWPDVLMPRTDAAPASTRPEQAAETARRQALEAAESRLRQVQRENGDLRRQIVLLKRRLEAQREHPPPAEWPD